MHNKITELFGHETEDRSYDWQAAILSQNCPFLNRKCLKNRKSQPETAIGTCSVNHGIDANPTIICPHRFLERRKIFLDCIHLLTLHEPGNELHILQEVSIPGGNVDYFLVSTLGKKVCDFVGIELQGLDTTGTIWPTRQRYLTSIGAKIDDTSNEQYKPFGINWKMTAKTTLVQLHHKIQTFEGMHKHLVLVTQDSLIEYMQREFSFQHISKSPKIGDAMHFHAYGLVKQPDSTYSISLKERLSTDSAGISKCLGLKASGKIELEQMLLALERKISPATMLTI
jgi:Restriction endonuclease NotI